MLHDFTSKWKPTEHHEEEYKSNFFTEMLNAIPKNEKEWHSLSNCAVYAEKHILLQKSYPRMPCF